MKKRMISLIVMMLVACLMLTGCSSATSGDGETVSPTPEVNETVEPETAPEQESETYEWTVGNGYVLTTKINIMDYIDGDSVRISDLARDLGFGDWEAMMALDAPTGFKHITDDNTITIQYDFKNNVAMNLLVTTNAGSEALVQNYGYNPTVFYNVNGGKKQISFDIVVCFTFACECYVDGGCTPFEGILPSHGELNYGLN